MKLQPSLEKKHFGKSFCFKKAKKVIKKYFGGVEFRK
jgi:hypothetical protein